MTKHQRRYYRRRATRRCVQCAAGLLDDEPHVQCLECRDRNNKYRKLKKRLVRDARAQRAKYHANPEPYRAARRLRTLDKKLRGECKDCTAPIAEDTNRCRRHLDQAREADRQRWRRKHGKQAA